LVLTLKRHHVRNGPTQSKPIKGEYRIDASLWHILPRCEGAMDSSESHSGKKGKNPLTRAHATPTNLGHVAFVLETLIGRSKPALDRFASHCKALAMLSGLLSGRFLGRLL
jgi:hypothetical protein